MEQQSQDGLNFPEALDAIFLSGETIARLEWDNDADYGALRDGILMIHRDGEWFQWIINDGDLFAEDWVVGAMHFRQSSQ